MEEIKKRQHSEEGERISTMLASCEQKLAKSSMRNRECLNMRQESLRRRNQSLNERVSMFRTQEQLSMERKIEESKESHSKRRAEMRKFYKQELSKQTQARQGR